MNDEYDEDMEACGNDPDCQVCHPELIEKDTNG